MCREALRSRRRHIYYAEIANFPHEGRLTLKKVAVLDEAGNKFLGYVDHVNLKKSPFKYKNYKRGDFIRFSGTSFLYRREDLSKDYTIDPGKKNRILEKEEKEAYKKYISSRKR